jgi:DNA-binding NarL/FixJ family response regulator
VVRVGVHASDPISLAGVTGCLRSEDGLDVRSSLDGAELDVLVVACGRLTPDTTSALRLLAGSLRCPIVLVCGACAEAELLSAVECGVVAVVPRSAVSREMLREYVLAAAGGATPRGADANDMVDGGWDDGELSLREIGVLRLVSEGLDTKEIAGEMHYSERTVKNILYGITQRLRLRNRSHAVAYALRAGLI